MARTQTRPGGVCSFSLSAEPPEGPVAPERRLPIAFDQARHIGFGSRPGPWTAVAITLPEPVDRGQSAEVWMAVIARHQTLRRHVDEVCDPFGAPSHRLCVVETPERGPQVVIVADHWHVDAWSLLILARELTTCLADLQPGRDPGAALPAARPVWAHTAMVDQRPGPSEELLARRREILRAGGRGDAHLPAAGQRVRLLSHAVSVLAHDDDALHPCRDAV